MQRFENFLGFLESLLGKPWAYIPAIASAAISIFYYDYIPHLLYRLLELPSALYGLAFVVTAIKWAVRREL